MIIVVPDPRDTKIRMLTVPEDLGEGRAADNTKSDILGTREVNRTKQGGR